MRDDSFFNTRAAFLRAYGVRWYLCPRNAAQVPDFLKGMRRHSWGPRFYAYEDPQAEPIMHLAGSSEPLHFTRQGNRLCVKLPYSCRKDTQLVASFYREGDFWRAFADGSPAPVSSDAFGRILVLLKRGTDRVEIEFYSAGFAFGIRVAAAGFISCCG